MTTNVNLCSTIQQELTSAEGYTVSMSGLCSIVAGDNYSFRIDYQTGTVVNISIWSLSIQFIEYIDQSSTDSFISSTSKYYIGDEFTDNSWWIFISGNDLKFQKRILGTWTDRNTILG